MLGCIRCPVWLFGSHIQKVNRGRSHHLQQAGSLFIGVIILDSRLSPAASVPPRDPSGTGWCWALLVVLLDLALLLPLGELRDKRGN